MAAAGSARYVLPVELESEVCWTAQRSDDASAREAECEFVRLRDDLVRTWISHFPARRGYLVTRQVTVGPVDGLHLRVQRGDFQAELNLSCEWRGAPGKSEARGLAVRVAAGATSDRLRQAELWQHRFRSWMHWSKISATLGWVAGALAFILVAEAPFAVALAIAVSAAYSGCAGTLTDRVISERKARVIAEVAGDRSVQLDVRRWKSIVRLFGRQRSSWRHFERGLPFRRALSTG